MTEVNNNQNQEPEVKPTEVEVPKPDDDGKVKVDHKNFIRMRDDMHTYKHKSTELEGTVAELSAKLDKIEKAKAEAEVSELAEKEEFKTLYEQEKSKNSELVEKIKQSSIDNALKQKAVEMGINDVDDIKLADLSTITIDESGVVQGVENALNNLKEKKGYLFDSAENKPKVDTSKPGDYSGITFKDLVNNPKKAVEMKKNDPALYERLRKEHFKR